MELGEVESAWCKLLINMPAGIRAAGEVAEWLKATVC
tara:strand:+ start:755 stop:865 length:111 start_codon:yes stop_codon:yes gene_type:complete